MKRELGIARCGLAFVPIRIGVKIANVRWKRA